MKREQLEKLLMTTAEEQPQVSDSLHQDIMRSVRQAGSDTGKASINWRIPAYGAALSLLVVYFIQPAVEVHKPSPDKKVSSENLLTDTQLMTLRDQLVTLSQHTLTPEEELRLEFERLKSDLKRFDIRS